MADLSSAYTYSSKTFQVFFEHFDLRMIPSTSENGRMARRSQKDRGKRNSTNHVSTHDRVENVDVAST